MAGEKRSAPESEELAQHQESVILLDIEGTTSSISFVKDSLFPHVREYLKKHVSEKWDDEEFKSTLAALKSQAKEDEEKKVDGLVPIKDGDDDEAKESIVKNVLWQMDNDRKSGALKQLQGQIWKAQYAPLKGHVYDDVPKAFEEWTTNGKKLYIYSSGSVEAQKLLFGNSVHGDLLKFFSGHFDTEVGPKQEADSYKNILKKIDSEASNVLFLTDVVKEAEAAKAAGMSATIVVREGNEKLSDEEKGAFKTVESFAEITFQSATKRQKLEEVSTAEKKETPNEEKPAVAANGADEPMDTSEDAVVDEKKPETTAEVVESKVEEKLVKEAEKIEETEKPAEKDEKNEKEATPMEEDVKTEKKTATKTETEKMEEVAAPAKEAAESEEKKEVVSEAKAEVPVESEKKSEEVEKKSEETEKKTDETTKVAEKAEEEKKVEAEKVEGPMTKKETEDAAEKTAEKVTEKAEEKAAEKVAEETTAAKKTEEEAKPEEKEEVPAVEKKPVEEVKENGEAKPTKQPTDDKVDDGENKENVATKVEKSAEPEVEMAEEAKEVEKEKEPEDKAKPEVAETQKEESMKLNGTTTNGESAKDVNEEKVHSNGVSDEAEKTKENGNAEDSLKLKKAALADGAGGPDVVTPPVVAATS